MYMAGKADRCSRIGSTTSLGQQMLQQLREQQQQQQHLL
jgi:hypothetical protein